MILSMPQQGAAATTETKDEIMQKGNLTREQAVATVGEKAVAAAESKPCEPTNRVGYNGSCQGDDLTEWSASVRCGDVVLTAYYYTTSEQDQTMAENSGDGSCIDWEIAGYEVA
jgi:hypothetical protein